MSAATDRGHAGEDEPVTLDPLNADIAESFARGDYHRVAATGPADRWETHAALALCGNIPPALDGLRRFDCPEARFYEGVAQWLAGNEDAAARLLEGCEGEHARNLLALIRKPKISVLAQLPWLRRGAHTILVVAENDPKFRIRNISFHPDDLPNEPYGNIHDHYEVDAPPDFYLSEMLEWHFVPPNIQALPCPIICHTADFDLHIQMLHPWLRLFDEVLVTDTTEHAAVTGLVDAPVSTVPKAFALPWTLPEPLELGRDLDLVLTGSLFHSFFPDKTAMIHKILRVKNLQPFFVNGFLPDPKYFEVLARSKLSVACLRHPGATPTRGLETLAMGCTLLAQSETTLRLWLGEEDGLLTYNLEDDSLGRAIEQVIANPETHAGRARRGREIVRREFDPWRVGAYYLRMATFLAARPRGPRRVVDPPVHKRPVARKGWLPHRHVSVLPALRSINLERFRQVPAPKHSVQSLNDPARELLLEHAYAARTPFAKPSADQRVDVALNMYRTAIQLKPESLALRFNFIRPALHFGSKTDIEQALAIAAEKIRTVPSNLTLDPLDDVMPWDYCQDFFNYRSYFDLATETLAGHVDGVDDLKKLVYASLHYYYGRAVKKPEHFAEAARLDPSFPVYRLWEAKHLASVGDEASADAAAGILSVLARDSMYAIEAWALLQTLKQRHGVQIPGEQNLQAAIACLESRTVLDEDYRSLRYSPYFRAQRLDLSPDENMAIVKGRERGNNGPVRLSVLLADLNGSRYDALLDALQRQTLPRNQYEVICADVFDCPSDRAMELADMVIVCGQNEYLYNRNVAFNFALVQASGDIVVFFDRATELVPDALAQIVELLSVADTKRLALRNLGAKRHDRFDLHFVAMRREAALLAGGLDESAFYAGALGGPHELARRVARRGFTVEECCHIPPTTPESAPGTAMTLETLLEDFWSDKFSPMRGIALRSNPEIEELRGSLM
ncbi:MAG: hypothetical protein MJE12_27065 [Alphaproteobacteria bacterium]|nr:hypothetical protein [Alphaproteobacteria bacterium]